MNIKYVIDGTRLLQKELEQAQKSIAANLQELANELDAIFLEKWHYYFKDSPQYHEVEKINGLAGGSHTTNWAPEVYIYSISEKYLTEAGGWAGLDGEPVEAPVRMSRLQEFMEAFRKATGIPIIISYRSFPVQDPAE